MTLDIVQFGTGRNDVNGTSSTVVTLAGCTPGNLLVMYGYIGNSNAPAITWPSGFTQQPDVGDPGEGRLAMAYRVCPSSPPSTWTITHGPYASKAAVIELPPAVFDVDTFQRTVSGASCNAPAITPTAAKDSILLIAGVWLPGYGFSTYPSGYTMVFEDFLSGPSARPYVMKKLVNPTSGTYGPHGYTAGGGVQCSTLHAAYYSSGGGGSTARSRTLVVTG